MRILFLSAWCPLPADNGSKLRISQLLRRLARSHTIDLLSFAPEPPTETAVRELHELCAHVELINETPFAARPVSRMRSMLDVRPHSMIANHSATMEAAVRRRETQRYDLVIASQLHMAPYALLVKAPRLLEEVELAILREQADAQPSQLARMRYGLTWWKTERYLKQVLRQFAGVTVVSNRERDLLQPMLSSRTEIEIVPNGVDLTVYSGEYGPPEPDRLIYPGALSYDANFDAVAYFAEAILPRIRAARPQVRLRVTGRVAPEQFAALPITDGLEFTGYLDDIRPAVAQAWAETVPLRKGGGTRLKVLEALALGTPVVSTVKGVEGLELLAERDVLIADDPSEFALQVLRLLESPSLRARLAANGRAVVQRYDWSVGAARLTDLISEVVRKNNAVEQLAARHSS